MRISKEKKFVLKVLFSSEKINKKEFDNLDYNKIVKLASKQLILPALYVKLKKKKYLKFLKKELVFYLKYIHGLNYQRNKKFLMEVKQISKLFNNNNIDHVFLKSAAYLLMGTYSNIGERMIGDIDILVHSNDINQAGFVLEKNGYFDINNIDFFPEESHHNIRKIHKKNIFAVEIHKRLLSKPYIMQKTNQYLKSKIKIEGINFMNEQNCALHLINNFMINDYGKKYQSFSIKVMYDFFYFSDGLKNLKKLNLESNINDFFIPFYLFDINGYKKEYKKLKKINLLRFKLKYQFLTYKILDDMLIYIFEKIKIFPKRLNELIKNKEYRIHIKRRVIDKLRS